MYHSNGNYEALVHARKPAGVDQKSAYIVGGGLAGLAAGVFLVRDAQMPGKHIHILEELPVAGGSLDGTRNLTLDLLLAEAVKWKTTLNVCGICIARFLH